MGIFLEKIIFSTSFLVSLHLEILGGFSTVSFPTHSPRFCSDFRHNTENRTMGYRNLLCKEGNIFCEHRLCFNLKTPGSILFTNPFVGPLCLGEDHYHAFFFLLLWQQPAFCLFVHEKHLAPCWKGQRTHLLRLLRRVCMKYGNKKWDLVSTCRELCCRSAATFNGVDSCSEILWNELHLEQF
jgi:hypothetical protein